MSTHPYHKYEEILHNMTQINEINKCLNEILNEERTIEANLSGLINRKSEIQDEMSTLTKNANDILEDVTIDTDQLYATIESTSNVANAITEQVRALDITQSNVKQTINIISVILKRNECLERLQMSMNENKFDIAAKCIEEFEKLEKEDEAEEKQRQIVSEYKKDLEQIVHKRFNEYVSQGDHDNIMYYTKLFKSLNKKEEGMSKFSDYLKVQVAMKGHENYKKLSEIIEKKENMSNIFINALTDLFKFIAVTIEENQIMILDVFGEDGLIKIIYDLQSECDNYGSKIINRLIEERNIIRLVKEVSYRKRKDINISNDDNEKKTVKTTTMMMMMDPRDMEIYIDEFILLCSNSEEYIEFMLSKAMKALTTKGLVSVVAETKFKEGTLSKCIREIIGYYITLEEYYMEENMKKAIEIDEYVSGNTITSMVDDTFFICKKCSMRVMATRNIQCICAILSLMNSLLTDHFVLSLKDKMIEGPNKFINTIFTTQENNEISTTLNQLNISLISFGIYLNNIYTGSEYILKLKSELENIMHNSIYEKTDKDAVKTILDELNLISIDLKKLANHYNEQMVDLLMPKFMLAFESLSSFNYELNERQYSKNELNIDTWPHLILRTFKIIYNLLIQILSNDNNDNALQSIIDRLLSRIELIMMRKNFNQLGALQMDRDIRLLISQFSDYNFQNSMRDKFSRLSQMSTILCLENELEILEYWENKNINIDDLDNALNSNITWKYTSGEIKTIMRLRSDFKDERIASLLL